VKTGHAIPTSPSPEGGFGNDHIDHMGCSRRGWMLRYFSLTPLQVVVWFVYSVKEWHAGEVHFEGLLCKFTMMYPK